MSTTIDEKTEILAMMAELDAMTEEVENLKKAEQGSKKTRREAEEALWKYRRKALMRTEKLGGYKAAGYKTFTKFCKERMGKVSRSTYTEELTYGYLEDMIFQIPIGTYNKGFFRNSGIRRGSHALNIRASGGKGIWFFNEKECDRARRAWAIAKENALQSHPDKPLPDVNDMRLGIAEASEIAYEPRLTSMEKALREVERLQREVKELKAAKAIGLPVAEYVNSLKEADVLIEMHCDNPAQQALARRMLIQESPEAAKRYVRSLIARRYQRERAA